jgi:hypothetical protein
LRLRAVPGRKAGDAGRAPDWEQFQTLLERIAINGQEFFNVDEAAVFTRLSPSTINRRKRQGILPYGNGGGDRVVFLREDLIALMKKAKVTSPAADRGLGEDQAGARLGAEVRINREDRRKRPGLACEAPQGVRGLDAMGCAAPGCAMGKQPGKTPGQTAD